MSTGHAYDPEQGPLQTCLMCAHTVVPRVLARPGLWLAFGLHLAVYTLYWRGFLSDEGIFDVDQEDVKVITAITTFFEVFYTNQCYSRYTQLWQLSRSMLSSIYEFAFVVRLYTRQTGKPYDRLATRWVVVSHLLFLFDAKGHAVEEKDWEKLCRMGLVRLDEVSFLDSMSGVQRQNCLIHMAADVARVGFADAKHTVTMSKETTQCLTKYREQQQQASDLLNFPMPFQYFHLLSLMIVCNLMVWAYCMALTTSIFAPFCYLLAAVIFYGMMDLASQLSNPFGKDDVDFPLDNWAAECLINVAALLNYDYPNAPKYTQELEDETRAKMRLKVDPADVEDFLKSTPLPRRPDIAEKQALLSSTMGSPGGSRCFASEYRSEGRWA